jgi:hypothetical protein
MPEVEYSVIEATVPHAVAEPNSDAIRDALDEALALVQYLQRSYHLTVPDPISIVTLERLPPMTIFAIAQVLEDSHDSSDSINLRVINTSILPINLHVWVGQPGRDPAALEQEVGGNLRPLRPNDQFFTFLEFRREAISAHRLLGDYRAAAMWSGAAAESLLDEVLQSLLWEELNRPEDCVEIFASTISARVRSQYGGRIGGNWSFGANARGPVAGWFRHTATLRNRVIHGGYSPTSEDADRALDALNALVTFLCDRLTNRTGRYPRTAWMLLGGEAGFARRNRRVPAVIDRLLADPKEVIWGETLFRWRECHARCRQDRESRRVPDAARSYIYVVTCPDGQRYFCFHDRVVSMAAKKPFVSGEMAAEHFRYYRQAEGEFQRRAGRNAFSIGFPPGVISSPAPNEWLEEYRLVPMAGVMVDGSDLDGSCAQPDVAV